MASEADKAYQGSLVLLSSLSRLTETDIGSFEVRALCLWDQEIPFCSPLCPPCYPASSSALPRAPSPLESHWIGTFPPFCPRSWLRHKEQETSIRRCLLWFPASTGEMLGPPGSHRISVFQGEATRLKQDASALLSLVDTYMAQYRQLQSRTGRWEEEIKQLLRRGEGERAVRGWLGRCGLSSLQHELEPRWDARGTTAATWCPSLFTEGNVALPACCRIIPFLRNAATWGWSSGASGRPHRACGAAGAGSHLHISSI